MDTRLAHLVGPVIGVLPVSVLYVDGYWDLQLAAVIWTVYAIAGWRIVRQQDVWRTRGNRWSSLLAVVLLGGAQFGVHMDLPIPENLTIALWFLFFGVSLASAAIGVEMAGTNAPRSRDIGSEDGYAEGETHSRVSN